MYLDLVESWALEELLVILVVEDDQPIQSLAEDALTDAGFEPAIAASGEEAVTLLQGNKGKYRALVIDINLRGRIDGWEVAKRAREIDSEFPVIYVTGASADQWGSRGVPNSVLMTKPFAPSQLVTAISQLLNRGTPPGLATHLVLIDPIASRSGSMARTLERRASSALSPICFRYTNAQPQPSRRRRRGSRGRWPIGGLHSFRSPSRVWFWKNAGRVGRFQVRRHRIRWQLRFRKKTCSSRFSLAPRI